MRITRFRFFRWRRTRSTKVRGTSLLFKRFSSFEGLELRALLSGGSLLSDSAYTSGLTAENDVHSSPVNLLCISSLMASNLAQRTSADEAATDAALDNPPPVAPLVGEGGEST